MLFHLYYVLWIVSLTIVVEILFNYYAYMLLISFFLEYSLNDKWMTKSVPRTTDALNWPWRAQSKSLFFLPCQRSEGRLMSPSLSLLVLFFSGKLVTGLVMLPLITLHRLSLSSRPGQRGGEGGRPGDTETPGVARPGPEGGITWSGLTQGKCFIVKEGFIWWQSLLYGKTLLPWGPMHVFPLG